MNRLFNFLFFLLINNFLFCQNLNNYFLNNSIKLENNLILNSSNDLNLFTYNAYFLGENHTSVNVVNQELKLINLLKNKINNIFIESPVSYYYLFQQLLSLPPNDTLPVDFINATGEARDEKLLRYFYKENCLLKKQNKYKIIPIDFVPTQSIFVTMIINSFSRRFKPKQIRIGLRYLNEIKKNDSVENKNEDSLLTKYIFFRESFYSNLDTYKSFLGDNFTKVQKYIDGIYTYSLVKKEDSICACKSDIRENFMLNNIMAQIKIDTINEFISINGSYHIQLIEDKKWDFMNNWQPLAAKFKLNNPNFNVCSIYLMDRNADDLGENYFPEEKKLILSNIKEGETYLIRLDGEGSPFKELSKKFQYIVVW